MIDSWIMAQHYMQLLLCVCCGGTGGRDEGGVVTVGGYICGINHMKMRYILGIFS